MHAHVTTAAPLAHDHVVHFYESDGELAAAVGPYLIEAARAGDVGIVIATESHRRAFAAELEAAGIDIAVAMAEGRFIALDAAATLAAFRPGGQIDPHAFDEVIGGLVRKAAGTARSVRAYGEMVALLWDAGEVVQALELETLWNDLARELPFSLFCSYPAASVAGAEHADALHEVCRLHSSVEAPPAAMAASYPAERDAPRRARHDVVAALRQADQGGAVLADAALVVSELATNAVRHAASPFSVMVRMRDSALRLAVSDEGDATAGGDGLIAQATHGLAVVEALATRWGVEPAAGGGKVVWAELPL